MKKEPSDKIGRVYPPLEGEAKLSLNGGEGHERNEGGRGVRKKMALRKGTLAIGVMMEETQ